MPNNMQPTVYVKKDEEKVRLHMQFRCGGEFVVQIVLHSTDFLLAFSTH